MEASLNPDLLLIRQLEKEIEREKQLLEQEEAHLNDLTKNAAREESSRKAQMKKVLALSMPANWWQMHTLLRENASSKASSMAINLISDVMVPPYDAGADRQLSNVLKDLSSHLTTMNTNLKEMKEVRAWINRTEESLGQVLKRLEGSPGDSVHRGVVL